MNHLEIKHLRMIRAIAETGNMTKAAVKLFISQSALSQQLKDIESKLEVDFFYRTRKKMILTPIGKNLLEPAKNIIDTIEGAELEIAKIVSGDRGELKVGTQCIFCYKWLPGVMRIIQSKFPNIEFEIGTANNLAEELESRKFDFIITAATVEDDTFKYIPLFADQMVCIMPQDHPLSGHPYIQFEDFTGFNLISHADRGSNRFYQLVLKPNGVEPKRFITVDQPHAIIEMVASGFGISIFPRWAVRDVLGTDGIAARPITKRGFPLTWKAAFLGNGQIPVFQQEFIHIVSKMNIDIDT